MKAAARISNIKRYVAVVTLAAFGIGGLPMQVHAASPADGICQTVRLPVALAQGRAANQAVSGNYCQPLTWASGSHEVDVMTPGATYNSSYWDWPQNPALYSYVDKTLLAGRATFAYDRIGTGASSHPLSTSITFQGDAYVLHEIIQWLRNTKGYTQVNTVGHSYGSGVTVQEAGTYNDENRVIITGLLHAPNPGLAKISDILYPANLDSYFSGLGLDSGYLTTIPDSRSVFYDTATADLSVIAYDNAHPDTIAATDLAGLATFELPPALNIATRITSPVLLVIGQEDGFFCASPAILNCSDAAAVSSYEAPYYSSAASLSVATVPSTGHDLTLHPSANESFNDINNWIENH